MTIGRYEDHEHAVKTGVHLYVSLAFPSAMPLSNQKKKGGRGGAHSAGWLGTGGEQGQEGLNTWHGLAA